MMETHGTSVVPPFQGRKLLFPGEAALWIGHRSGFWLPVRVAGDGDALSCAKYHLKTFDEVKDESRGFGYFECTGTFGDGNVTQVTAAQARELLLQRMERLRASYEASLADV